MNLGRVAFTLDRKPVTVGDVLAASWLGGWSADLEARVRRALACESRADEAGIDLPAEDIEGPLEAWRRQRDLIAAEELEAWLAARELTVEELCDHIERGLLVRQPLPDADPAAHEPDQEDLLAILPAEAAFGGELDHLIEQHAQRCVAPPPPAGPRPSAARSEILAGRGATSLDELADVREAFEVERDRLEWLLDVEVAFRIFREETASEQKLKAALVEFRDQLVKFEIMSATCPTEDVAREVLCCIRIDRDPFTRSVARAGVPCRKDSVFASDVGRLPFGHRFQAAQARELFGPERAGHGHVVAQLVERHDPDLATPGVARWLTERLIDRSLRRALNERVSFGVPESE